MRNTVLGVLVAVWLIAVVVAAIVVGHQWAS